jgi:hypothetical protein
LPASACAKLAKLLPRATKRERIRAQQGSMKPSVRMRCGCSVAS